MQDRVRITSDPSGYDDDTWDPDLRRYTQAGATTVYEGPAMVSVQVSVAEQDETQGGQEVSTPAATAAVPLTVDGIVPGQWLTVIAVNRRGDQHLVGRTFRIGTVGGGTYAVLRQLGLEERVVAEPRK